MRSTCRTAVVSSLATLAAFVLGMGIGACGSAAVRVKSASRSASAPASPPKRDRDNDGDNNDDDAKVLAYGRAANATERQIAVTLTKRYFVAAATEDGALACRLLAPLFADIVVETYGNTPALRGRTCPAVMSRLFVLHHQLLVRKSASIRVTAVRIKGDRMLAVLEFPPMPEVRQIEERRVGGTWTIFALLDGIIE